MMTVDYRLNALVDASLADIAPLAELAAVAARHGATIIQYRDKAASTRQMIEPCSLPDEHGCTEVYRRRDNRRWRHPFHDLV